MKTPRISTRGYVTACPANDNCIAVRQTKGSKGRVYVKSTLNPRVIAHGTQRDWAQLLNAIKAEAENKGQIKFQLTKNGVIIWNESKPEVVVRGTGEEWAAFVEEVKFGTMFAPQNPRKKNAA